MDCNLIECYDFIDILIPAGANLDVQDKNGNTSLHIATSRKELETMKLLIEYGASRNIQNNDSSTALHIALERGIRATSKLLIEMESGSGEIIDITLTDRFRRTIIHYATEHEIEGIIKLATRLSSVTGEPIETYLDMKDCYTATALSEALSNNHNALALALIKAGASFDDNVLFKITDDNSIPVLKALIKSGISINTLDRYGNTIIHRIIASLETRIIRLLDYLLSIGVNPNVQNANNGSTSLHYAVRSKGIQAIELLLKYKADPNIQDDNGMTPLHHAIKSNNTEVISILLKASANPNIINNEGYSSLHTAAYHGSIEIIILLLPTSDKALLTKNEETAYDIAVRMKHTLAASFLK